MPDHNEDVRSDDQLAKESDVTVGGGAVPPETEYLGFALYVGSSVTFFVYLVWAGLPQTWLHALNIYHYPSRWWALAIPSYAIMFVIYIYVALTAYNVEILTKTREDLQTITDLHGSIVRGPEFVHSSPDGVWDLALSDVCRVLYSDQDS